MAGRAGEHHVEVNGVRVWYAEQGKGDPLVLLHPGGVDSRTWASNLAAFAAGFRTFTPDRRGHGRTPDVAGPITYELMAEDTAQFIDQVIGTPARLVGCSDGAIVALHVALRHPHLVERLVCVAGPFHRDGWVPSAIDPAIEPPPFFATSYGEVSPDGIAHFPVVAAKLSRMHVEEPTLTVADLRRVTCRTLVMVGDDDEVTLEHALLFYRALPSGEFAVVPGTSHGLLVEKPELCNRVILDFLNKDAVRTFAPIRRVTT